MKSAINILHNAKKITAKLYYGSPKIFVALDYHGTTLYISFPARYASYEYLFYSRNYHISILTDLLEIHVEQALYFIHASIYYNDLIYFRLYE